MKEDRDIVMEDVDEVKGQLRDLVGVVNKVRRDGDATYDRLLMVETLNACLEAEVKVLRERLDCVDPPRRQIIDLTSEEEEDPLEIPGLSFLAETTLVPIEEPAPVSSGTLDIALLILQYIELIPQTGQRAVRTGWSRYFAPLPPQEEEFRDFQMEVETQRLEAYQCADEEVDRLVMQGRALPSYVDPPEYDGPPSYYASLDYACRPLGMRSS